MTTIPDIDDAIAELERELAVRKNVYPKWVATGRLKADTADRQLARLMLALDNLRDIAALTVEDYAAIHAIRQRQHAPLVP